jgi:hypothetical protein
MKIYLVVYRSGKEVKVTLVKQYDEETVKKYVQDYVREDGKKLTILLVTPFDFLVVRRLGM